MTKFMNCELSSTISNTDLLVAWDQEQENLQSSLEPLKKEDLFRQTLLAPPKSEES